MVKSPEALGGFLLSLLSSNYSRFRVRMERVVAWSRLEEMTWTH